MTKPRQKPRSSTAKPSKRGRLALALLLTLALAAAAIAYSFWQVHKPLQLVGVLEVERGQSLNSLLGDFKRQGLIGSEFGAKLVLRWLGVDSQIRSGDYQLPQGLNLLELISALNQGEHQISYKFTIIEGQSWSETAERLWAQDTLQISTKNNSARTIIQQLDPNSPRQYLEGLLLAETYLYKRGSSDLSILRQAYQSQQQLLQDLWQQRDPSIPLTNPYEALIIASIVEKETSLASERARIAAVFYNRIRRNMPLQSDPTIIFGLGASFDGNLKRSHLRDKSNIYNSYAHKGLTPTPIAMVGRDAIAAVMQPIQSDELYFVSRGDGSHQFSTNLPDHNRAVRKYQLGR